MGAGRRAIDRDALASYDVRGRAVLVHTGWDRYWGTERYGTGNPFVVAPSDALCALEARIARAGTTIAAPGKGASGAVREVGKNRPADLPRHRCTPKCRLSGEELNQAA